MLALLLDCGSDEPTLIDRWREDPDGVAAELAALPPPEQLAAVEALLIADPEGVGRLCGSLPDGDARSRCRTVRTRPHLWREDAAETPTIPSPLSDIPPATGPCDAHDNPTLCWSRHARGRASGGDAQGAAAGCLAIAEPQWRQECAFQSAEELLVARGPSRYPDAVSLCALAGRFTADCLEHSVARLAALAPETPGGDWRPVLDAAAAITERWQGAPRQGSQQRQALWALSTALVYVEAPAVSGAPLAVLPEEAAPHVRAAMAWRLLSLNPGEDLATLTDRLAQAAATHQDTAAPTRPRRALVGLLDAWGEAEPPQGAAEVTWLGVSRRVVSPDPDTDGVIALLEAAARQPGQQHLLAEGRRHSDPLVAWTAARLEGVR